MEKQKYELKNNKSMNLKQQTYKGEQQKYKLKPKNMETTTTCMLNDVKCLLKLNGKNEIPEN